MLYLSMWKGISSSGMERTFSILMGTLPFKMTSGIVVYDSGRLSWFLYNFLLQISSAQYHRMIPLDVG